MALNGISGVGGNLSSRGTYRADKVPQKEGWKVKSEDSWKATVKPSGKYKVDITASSKPKVTPSYNNSGNSSSTAPKGSNLDILV